MADELFLDNQLISQIDKIAASEANILILGESGTGKEIVANRIHTLSKRSQKSPIIINVSAIPADLLERELFGSVKGAFTGSDQDYKGVFQSADGSTLILDEIGELPLSIQGKLLNSIEKGIIHPVGSNSTIKVDCRIIAITNRNLKTLVDSGVFRMDLYYRLNVISLELPPLRDRDISIKSIVYQLISTLSPDNVKLTIDSKAMDKLILHDWPGNIRELKNCLERAIALSNNSEITVEYLLLSSANNGNISCVTLKEALADFKKKYIKKVLECNDWNVTKTAGVLDIQRTYLSRLIKELYNNE